MTKQPDAAAQSAIALDRYDNVSIVLHWLTAILVLLLFGTSLVWNYVTPHDRFWRRLMEGSHVSLGILFAALILIRIVWRSTAGKQVAPEPGSSGLLSGIMYRVLYVTLAAEAILGFVLRWLQGEDFTFFGLFSVPGLLAANRDLSDVFEQLHNYVGWVIVLLSFGHALAALIHRYWLRDGVLQRMTFGPPAA